MRDMPVYVIEANPEYGWHNGLAIVAARTAEEARKYHIAHYYHEVESWSDNDTEEEKAARYDKQFLFPKKSTVLTATLPAPQVLHHAFHSG